MRPGLQAGCHRAKYTAPIGSSPTAQRYAIASLADGTLATPQPVLQALNEALKAALRSDAVKKRLGDLGTEPVPPQDVTPAALRAHLEAQIDKWGKVVKAARIPLE